MGKDNLTMVNKYAIIDCEDDDFGDTITPEYDEFVDVLTRSDEKEYKRKTIEKCSKKAFRASKKIYR